MNRPTNDRGVSAWIALLLAFLCVPATANRAQADPFKLGVEDSTTVPGQGSYQYPAPQMVAPTRPMQANVQNNVQKSNFLQGNAQQQQAPPPPRRPPMQLGVQRQVALPPGYLGVWHVMGRRQRIDAQPEFQAGAERSFAPQTDNTWQISGSPGNYQMGNGAVNTQLVVDKIGDDGTAFIRYAEPIDKIIAQEAIVVTLAPNGMQFTGLERVSIIKSGNPEPRAKVTYQLVGQRVR